MRENGFKIRGNLYYYIKNDIAYCIRFEQPTGLLYCQFYIIPLYMPTDVHYYSFGNRMNYFQPQKLPILTNTCSAEDIQQWFQHFYSILKNYILPFYEKISHPKYIEQWMQRNRSIIKQYFFSPDTDYFRLRMYTSFYLGDLHMLSTLLPDAINDFKYRSNLREDIRQHYIEEANRLYQCLQDDPIASKELCRQTIRNTAKSLFKENIDSSI